MFSTLPTRPAGRAALCALWLAAALAPAGAAPVDDPGAPLTLAQAVQIAGSGSPLLAASRAQTAAAGERVTSAGQRPDPVFKAGIVNLPIDGADRFSVTRDFMTMRALGVAQEITRDAKLAARTQRAERELGAAEIAQQATLAGLQRDAALAWLERSFQESMRALLQAQLEQARLQSDTAQSLYAAGKGGQADVFAARGEVERWRDRIEQVDNEIAVATTQLARWIGDAARRPIGPRPALALPEWARGERARELDQHPQIAAAVQQEALADSEARLAREAKSSDWSVELMVGQRGSAYSNMMSLTVSVPLQWDQRQRQDRELAARLAQVEQARALREDVQRAHAAEVDALLRSWRSLGERLQRYDGALLPLAAQRSDAALGAYRGGGGALPAVLDARRGEIELRMEQLRLELERARLWARLNYLLPQADGAAVAATTPRTTP